MVTLYAAAILVGLCASFTLRIVPFVLLLLTVVCLRMGFLLANRGSGAFGAAILVTWLCFAIAQGGYVVGLVAQSFIGGDHAGRERYEGVMGALRRLLLLQRK